MELFWHRRDLRTADNLGLAAAADAGDVVPVFCFDDAVLDHAAPSRMAFMLDALAALRERYRELGGDLLVRHGDPSAVLPDLAREFGADRVVWNHDYSGLARERDEAVRAALDDQGTAHEQVHDAVLHEPGAIRTNAGDPYSVYTYFWKKWRDREKADPAPEPEPDAVADVTGDELPDAATLGFEEPDAEIPAAGTDAARERLEAFCERDVFRYEDARDYPAERATSRLSADLKFGTLGVRELYERTEQAMTDADDDDERASVEEFQGQLAWREFYAQVLYFNPEVVTENFKEYAQPIEWRDDPTELRAWKDGETGYPIVDAGMRQLRDDARRRVPHERPAGGLARGVRPFPRAPRRPRHGQRHRRLAVGRLDRHRRPAVLPGVQPDDAGRALRPGRGVRQAVRPRVA
jgi:deoxyribodipyrimidine photo-lyase